MRLIRFALAALVIFLVVGSSLAQQPQQTQQQREQQAQEQQQQQRQGQQGQGRGGGRGGQQPVDLSDIPPSDFKTYSNTQDFFSIHVPCTFQVRDIEWHSEYANKLPGRVYECSRGQENYTMTVINYTDVAKVFLERERTSAEGGGGGNTAYARIDVQASVDYAATKFRQEAYAANAKMGLDNWHYIDLIPGHQVQFTKPNGERTFTGIYLHEYRLYIMRATVPGNLPPPGLFQQSLSILRPDGGRIRYQSIYRHPW